MAERRMFSRRIVESARFLKMPASSQNLYFHLGLNADDDGVVEAFPVINLIRANEDDLRVLVGKGFVQVLNEDYVSYIRDWNHHNRIRADRKKDSYYKDLLLRVNPSAELVEMQERSDTRSSRIPGRSMDGPRTAQCSVGKVSTGKDSIDKCSVYKAHTPSVKYEMDNEILTEEDYHILADAYTEETVDRVIGRILEKPYHGCLNKETIATWCREKTDSLPGKETGDTCAGLGDRLHELAGERGTGAYG